MFIPGQVRMNRIVAFMDEYKAKNSQYADGKSGNASAIKEVTYSKPESGTASKSAPSQKRGSRTTTY
jgi:hypothetical protein